ncbi:MAG: exodeoxyribonuclease VII large subunit [Desulfobacterales bacterium]|nr:MAG: exodeoxyribonuclease VII large subunit [Desulfobacterales bacterium]
MTNPVPFLFATRLWLSPINCRPTEKWDIHVEYTDNGPTPKIYTVSELNANIKHLLEEKFSFIWICGEISNLRIPTSGHFYFTLKDENSQINAVMFRGQQRHVKFDLADGLSITGMGRISVYSPRGTYQIILEYVEPAGIGALQLAFEKLKARLAEEGFFDPKYKKPLPFLPRKIAIITSPTGAVVHDILKIVHCRFPNVAIEIIPVKVQGEGAEQQICAGIELLNTRAEADVAILARGGGSLEDLQAFNSEPVARAIFASKIPLISSVGHETDYTIADFVADVRAPTPSAAAELVIPAKADMMKKCHELSVSLNVAFNNYIEHLRSNLAHISKRLVDPKKKIQDLRLRVDDLTGRLSRLARSNLHFKRERLLWWRDRLSANNPRIQITKLNSRLEQFYIIMLKSFMIYVNKNKLRLRAASVKLHALSPLAVLDRGYSLTRTIPDKRVVRDSATVSLNQDLEVMVAKGRILCRVKGKFTDGQKDFRTIAKTT